MKKILSIIVLSLILLLSACTKPADAGTEADSKSESKSISESENNTTKKEKKNEPKTEAHQSKNPISISLWHYYNGENRESLEKAVTEFNETLGIENGVIVNAVAKGNTIDLEKAVKNSALGLVDSEPMPDIFSSYPDTAMEIDRMGLLCDLNKYFTEEEKAAFVDVYVNDGIFREGVFSLVPIAKSIELLYVNDTEFKAFATAQGLSYDDLSTWEGIYKLSAKYYEYTDAMTPDVIGDGKSMMGFDSVPNFVIIASKQLGVDVINADKETALLDKKVLRRLFDNFYKGYSLGYYGDESKFRTDDVKTGKIISYAGSSSGAVYFPTSVDKDGKYSDVHLLALPYPKFEGGENYSMRQGAGMCVSVSDERREEAAVLFLKWFSDLDKNIKFVSKSGYLPVKKEAYKEGLFNEMTEAANVDPIKNQNVTAVNNVTMEELRRERTYAAKSFLGSYEIRNILGNALYSETKYGYDSVNKLRGEGLKTEAEILSRLDVDKAFDTFMEDVINKLQKANIPYTVVE